MTTQTHFIERQQRQLEDAHLTYRCMSALTQQDVREIVSVLRSPNGGAARRFDTLARLRNWKLWETAAIANVCRTLAKDKGFKTELPEWFKVQS